MSHVYFLQELSLDKLYAGVISSMTSFGCFVALPHGLIGVADKGHLCSRFINSPSEVFAVGQSVFAQLTKVSTIYLLEHNKFYNA